MNRNQLKDKLEKMAYLYNEKQEIKPLFTLLEEENQKYDLSIRLSNRELTETVYKYGDIPKNKHYHVKKLSEVEEKPIEWLITNYIPKNEITVLCGEGSIGKGFIVGAIACALSSGKQVFFESEEEYLKQNRQPQKVLFISSEEDSSRTLKGKKFAQGDYNEDNIYVQTSESMDTHEFKIGSKALKSVIHDIKPQLVIIDPLQSFIPPKANISDKTTMRDLLWQLKDIAVQEDTSFIIISHTNKREASGLYKIADSSEIWNVPRVVFMVGQADEHLRYMSQEKNNLAKTQLTTLFEIFDGEVVFRGTTPKKDEDFANLKYSKKQGNNRDEIKSLILQTVKESENKEATNKELKEIVVDNSGFSLSTFNRAKKELIEEGKIESKLTGSNQNRTSVLKLKK